MNFRCKSAGAPPWRVLYICRAFTYITLSGKGIHFNSENKNAEAVLKNLCPKLIWQLLFGELCKFIFKIDTAVTPNNTTVINVMWHDICIIGEFTAWNRQVAFDA